MSSKERTDDIILQHEENGYYTIVDGVRTFALDTGTGPVVFCIHGVPTSSFLYRKIAQELDKLVLTWQNLVPRWHLLQGGDTDVRPGGSPGKFILARMEKV